MRIWRIAACVLGIGFLLSGCSIDQNQVVNTLVLERQSIDLTVVNPELNSKLTPVADVADGDIFSAVPLKNDDSTDTTTYVLHFSGDHVQKLFEIGGAVKSIKKVDDALVLLCTNTGDDFSLKCFDIYGQLIWDTPLDFRSENAEINVPIFSLSNERILVGALVDESEFITRHYYLDTDGEILTTFETDSLLARLTYFNGAYYCTRSKPLKVSINYIPYLGGVYSYSFECTDAVKIDVTDDSYSLVPFDMFDAVDVLDTVGDRLIVANSEAIYSTGSNSEWEKLIDVQNLGYTLKKDEYLIMDKAFARDEDYFVLMSVQNHQEWYGKKYLINITDSTTPELFYITDTNARSYVSGDTITFLSHSGDGRTLEIYTYSY